jgi:hypothetical protein
MSDVHTGFEFVDGGRTFTCAVEPLRAPQPDAWWWFRVSTDDAQRYAPFRAVTSDTPDTVRDRVVAYYDDLTARRARPPFGCWSCQRWSRSLVRPAR